MPAPDQVAGRWGAQALGLALGLAVIAVAAACIATGVTAQIAALVAVLLAIQLATRFASRLAAWFETPERIAALVAPLERAPFAARVAIAFLAAPLAAAIPRPGSGTLGQGPTVAPGLALSALGTPLRFGGTPASRGPTSRAAAGALARWAGKAATAAVSRTAGGPGAAPAFRTALKTRTHGDRG